MRIEQHTVAYFEYYGEYANNTLMCAETFRGRSLLDAKQACRRNCIRQIRDILGDKLRHKLSTKVLRRVERACGLSGIAAVHTSAVRVVERA